MFLEDRANGVVFGFRQGRGIERCFCPKMWYHYVEPNRRKRWFLMKTNVMPRWMMANQDGKL
jgi:hypothetical protein